LFCKSTVYQCNRLESSSALGDKASDTIKTQTKSKKPLPEGSSEINARSEVTERSSTKVRQLTLRSNIASHDLDVKMSHVCDWLSKGNEVKVIVVKGSGSAKLQGLNTSLFDKVLKATQDIAVVRMASKTDADFTINLTARKSSATPNQSDRSEKVPKPYTAAELKKMRDAETKLNEKPSKTKTSSDRMRE